MDIEEVLDEVIYRMEKAKLRKFEEQKNRFKKNLRIALSDLDELEKKVKLKNELNNEMIKQLENQYINNYPEMAEMILRLKRLKKNDRVLSKDILNNSFQDYIEIQEELKRILPIDHVKKKLKGIKQYLRNCGFDGVEKVRDAKLREIENLRSALEINKNEREKLKNEIDQIEKRTKKSYQNRKNINIFSAPLNAIAITMITCGVFMLLLAMLSNIYNKKIEKREVA